MVALVEDGQPVIPEGLLAVFFPAQCLDHTDRAIVFARIHLRFRPLEDSHAEPRKEHGHFAPPLVHEKLLVHNDEEPLPETGGDLKSHERFTLSTGNADEAERPSGQERVDNVRLVRIRGALEICGGGWHVETVRENGGGCWAERFCTIGPGQIPASGRLLEDLESESGLDFRGREFLVQFRADRQIRDESFRGRGVDLRFQDRIAAVCYDSVSVHF